MTTGIAGEEELVLYALGVVCLFVGWIEFDLLSPYTLHILGT